LLISEDAPELLLLTLSNLYRFVNHSK